MPDWVKVDGIYTATGTHLDNVYDRNGGVTLDSDPRTCDYIHFDLTSEQLGRTRRYNCWGFTFLPRRYWINSDTDVDNILRDNCDPVPDGSVHLGDIVRYRDDDDVTTHTGRVWQTDGAGHATLIRSKWGGWAEYLHLPLDVPGIYGNHLAYFRQKAPLLGIGDLWIKYSPGDNGEQHPTVPLCTSPDILIDAPPYDDVPDINPVVGSPNRVWAVVRNRSDQLIEGVYVRYYWVNPATGLAPSNWNLIPGTPGHPNPAGPISIPGNSSTEAPYVEWTPTATSARRCLVAVAYINDDPQDSNNADPLVYPFEPLWDNNIAIGEAGLLVELQTSSLNFNDIPEGETTVRAVVFIVKSCRAATFQIISGPTVLSGPPGTSFGTPLGTTATLGSTADFISERAARIWISYTGTNDGDTASGSVTVRCVETNEEWIIPITANTVKRPTVAVVLALDKSNSMTFDSGIPGLKRIDVLHFSAPPFVDVIQEDNAIGIVSFDHDAYDVMPVTGPLGPAHTIDVDRMTAKTNIASHMPNPHGWTSIGDAVELAHTRLTPVTGYDLKAMIVLTDGHENRPKYLSEVTDIINERVFAIGLGTADQIRPATLNTLTNSTGGYLLMTGALDIDAYFRLTKYYLQILAGVTNHDIVTDPEGYVAPGQEHRIPFQLNETDISTDVILLSPAPYVFKFLVETPDGDVIDPGLASSTVGSSFVVGSNVCYYRMTLPVPVGATGARSGTWHVVLKIEDSHYYRYLKSLVEKRELYQATLAHGIHYSLSVHAYSNLRMQANLWQDSYEPGATMILRVRLTEYGLPVENRANVIAQLVRPDNTVRSLTLTEVEPSVFEVKLEALTSGIYHFRVIGRGTTLRGQSFSREQQLTGSVYRGGDEPSPTPKDDLYERLCRLLKCLLSEKTISKDFEKKLHQLGINLENIRRCLRLYCADQSLKPSLPSLEKKLVESIKMQHPEIVSLLKRLMDETDLGA